MSRSSHNSPVQITDSRKRFLLLVHDRCRLFASRFFLRVTVSLICLFYSAENWVAFPTKRRESVGKKF